MHRLATLGLLAVGTLGQDMAMPPVIDTVSPLAGTVNAPLTTTKQPFSPQILNWPPQNHCENNLPIVPQCQGGNQPPFTEQSKILIVGAGPAGISMAHFLRKLGYRNVKILEKTNRIGGLAKTNMVNGVAHEMGACYTAGRYSCILKFLDEFFLTRVLTPGLGFVTDPQMPGAKGIPTEAWQMLNWAQAVGNPSPNPASFRAALEDAMVRYRDLYFRYFGNGDYLFPEKPNQEVLNDLTNGTFKDFLVRNKLEALVPLLAIAQSANGYGFLEEVPLYYGFIWSTPSIFKGLIENKADTAISMILEGFEELFRRMSRGMDVVLNAKITNIRRTSKRVYVDYSTPQGGTKRETFDYLMLAARFPETLDFLDERPDEADIFNRLKSSKIYTRMVSASGLPKGYIQQYVNFLRESPQDKAGVYYLRRELGLLYPNLTETPDIYVTGQQVGFRFRDKVTEADVDKQMIDDLTSYGGKDIKILDRLSPDYFARFSNDDIRQGMPWKLYDLQGKYRTWYVGSFASFESVADIVDYHYRLLEKKFCRRAPSQGH
eukprot:comp22715_c0_seq1/m.35275 comp22715_c0_seq1/g.35275  ORF comp22715_c0_seq1/g.35275 comp22715_c0_seq1/m.35275 type:complete len:546 (-) comp22715_c0_seq1:611-2248(-)